MLAVRTQDIRQTRRGAVALDCPYCGEITVADLYALTRTENVNMIEVDSDRAGRIVQCRLCGMISDAPSWIKKGLAVKVGRNDCLADEDLIRQTNTRAAAGERPEWAPELELFQDQAPRHQLALLQSSLQSYTRVKVEEMPVVLSLALAGLIGGGMAGGAVANSVTGASNPLSGTMGAVAGAILGGFAGMVIAGIQRRKAAHKDLCVYVERMQKHCGVSAEETADSGRALGGDFVEAAERLERCAVGLQAN